ncbi:MAG: ABC transporter permease [Acidobacteriia bacterium]|nr:ABC transporter permease [Terriglobia bacterium]
MQWIRINFMTAYKALARHKMRAVLTMLGISIGIAAVIAMVSIGQGANQAVIQQLENMGTNMLFVEAGNRQIQGVRTAYNTMMYEDVVAVRSQCISVKYASPNVDFRAQVGFEDNNWNTQVSGVDLNYRLIRHWNVVKGDFFTDQDITSANKVAVLGQTVVDQLFPDGQSPIGQTMRIRGNPYKIVGVFEEKGTSVTGQDQDDIIIIPWTTAQHKMLGIRWIKDMYISVVSREAIGMAKQEITAMLRQRHHLRPDQPDDFSIRDYTEIADMANETNRIMTLLLATVASLALFIGGINTMNIMLVTVTERTREIGVRLAVGAHQSDVRLQFLIEAIALTIVGGFIGVALGIATSAVISNVLQWPTIISLVAIAVGLGVSAFVGMVFGYYPAHKAATLDPIEALRYE